MNATEKRLILALLFAAGAISFNVYMVLTGAAGDFYDQFPGSAARHEAYAPAKVRMNLHPPVFRHGIPIDLVV
jgi:hypothetical protein